MAAPNPVEILNLQTLSLYRHYFSRRLLYVGYGRAIVAGIRVMLQNAAPTAQLATPTVTEEDIAMGLLAFLNHDANWLSYLGRIPHMSASAKAMVTDTMARFIAWEGYADIIK